ncbi:hypothetical protein F0562_013351 [Nyssa sinensis]|uniref:Uncharacterized protein n=1 Tax=Nyssa sinensis TaxID=561372 RepID=A0A5J4ZKI3_9ASTE|nr:hypothetical protein F0562_013351 [Nyssa sinensis]
MGRGGETGVSRITEGATETSRTAGIEDSGGSSAGGCGGEGDVVTIAGVFENRAEQVIQAKAEGEKGCLNGWCPVVKSRYSLNRKAKKMTEVIEL